MEDAASRDIFLHIPKTAGTTLKEIVRRQYDPNNLVKCYYEKTGESVRELAERCGRLSRERQGERMCFVGHMGFGLHDFLSGPSVYFTMIRNPIDRVVSGYYHARRSPNHRLHAQAQTMDIEEFVGSGLVSWMDNGQTRLLSGADFEGELHGRGEIAFGQCPPELLERAKRNLKRHFRVVGVTERFDESLLLLKKAFGWGDISYARLNVGRNVLHRSLSKAARDLLTNYNNLDLELYAYAEALLGDAIHEHGPALNRHVKYFALLNGVNDRARGMSRSFRSTAKRALRHLKVS
jgi:hypothetical protein